MLVRTFFFFSITERYKIEYGDGGSNHYLKHLINNPQIFIVQKKCIVDPMVQSIWMGVKLGITDWLWGPYFIVHLDGAQRGPH